MHPTYLISTIVNAIGYWSRIPRLAEVVCFVWEFVPASNGEECESRFSAFDVAINEIGLAAGMLFRRFLRLSFESAPAGWARVESESKGLTTPQGLLLNRRVSARFL